MCIPGTRAGGAGGGGGRRKGEASGRAAGGRTGRALRRSTTKLSARCIRKRENLDARIASISSSCFTLMLMRTELTAVSIIMYSWSERWMTIGLSRSSRLMLRCERRGEQEVGERRDA